MNNFLIEIRESCKILQRGLERGFASGVDGE